MDAVIVLGMHRSGTSSVTGALSKLGGTLPKRLMASNAANAAGYFESKSIQQFNDDLLGAVNSNWLDWQKFDQSWYGTAEAERYLQRAQDLFVAEFAGGELAVLKDPRICRLAPFWLKVLKRSTISSGVAMPVRSPLEVAQSLKTRNGLAIANGAMLWLRHVLDAEFETRNARRSIFLWDQFRSNWRSVVEKISAETGISWPVPPDRAGQEIDAFIDAGLVHAKFDRQQLIVHPAINDWIVGAYDALLELANNPQSNSAEGTLDEIRRSFDQACAAFGPVLSTDRSAVFSLLEPEERRLAGAVLRYEQMAAVLLGKEEVIDALKARAHDLETRAREAQAEVQHLTTLLGDQIRRHHDLENEAAEQIAATQRAAAAAVDASEAKAAKHLDALEDQSRIAEAALARLSRQNRRHPLSASILASLRAQRILQRSGLFDAQWYRTEYPDAVKEGASPVRHYLEEGYLQGCRPNPLFDSLWYLRRYEDVRRSGMNPLLHYIQFGCREGRDPGPDFQTEFYLIAYPDVRASGMNPLAHYLRFGQAEGRLAKRPQGKR